MNLKNSKKLVFILAILLIGVVSAGVLSYFVMIKVNTEVTQAIQVDGRDYNERITHNVELVAGETKYLYHNVTNNLDMRIENLSWVITGNKQGINFSMQHYSIHDTWVNTPNPFYLLPNETLKSRLKVTTDITLKPKMYRSTIKLVKE